MNNLSVSSTVSTSEGLRLLSYLSTTIVYVLFGVFGIIGNGLVLLVIARVDDLQSVTNLFIANQSLIDLCTSVILIATYVLPLPSLPKDRPGLATFICRYWYSRYPFWSLIVASSLNLVLMTLERFCAVFYPIRFRQHTNYKLLKFIALFPWAIGFLFQLSSGYFASFDGNDCILSFFSNPAFKNIFQPAAISLEFILPVFAMVVVYTAIFIRLRNDGMRAFNRSTRSGINDSSKAANQQPRITDYRSRARINTIKTLLIVSAFFILCWSTNMILFFIFSCCGGGVDLNSLLYKISVFLGFGNMWINPFIYSFQYRWFQKGLRKVFCKGNRKSNTEAVQTISKARNQTSETVSL